MVECDMEAPTTTTNTLTNVKIQDGIILKLNSQVNKGKSQLSKCNQIIDEKSKEIDNLNDVIHNLKSNVRQCDGELNLLRFQLNKVKITGVKSDSPHFSTIECDELSINTIGQDSIHTAQVLQENWMLHYTKSKSWRNDLVNKNYNSEIPELNTKASDHDNHSDNMTAHVENLSLQLDVSKRLNMRLENQLKAWVEAQIQLQKHMSIVDVSNKRSNHSISLTESNCNTNKASERASSPQQLSANSFDLKVFGNTHQTPVSIRNNNTQITTEATISDNSCKTPESETIITINTPNIISSTQYNNINHTTECVVNSNASPAPVSNTQTQSYTTSSLLATPTHPTTPTSNNTKCLLKSLSSSLKSSPAPSIVIDDEIQTLRSVQSKYLQTNNSNCSSPHHYPSQNNNNNIKNIKKSNNVLASSKLISCNMNQQLSHTLSANNISHNKNNTIDHNDNNSVNESSIITSANMNYDKENFKNSINTISSHNTNNTNITTNTGKILYDNKLSSIITTNNTITNNSANNIPTNTNNRTLPAANITTTNISVPSSNPQSHRHHLIALSPTSFKHELSRIQQNNNDVRDDVARFRQRFVLLR